MTSVSHTNYSPKFKVSISVSLKHLGQRRDKGLLKRGGKVVGGGELGKSWTGGERR